MVFGVAICCSGLLTAGESELIGYSDGVKANLLNKPGQRFSEFTVSWSKGKVSKKAQKEIIQQEQELTQAAVVSLFDENHLIVPPAVHVQNYFSQKRAERVATLVKEYFYTKVSKKGAKEVADLITTHFTQKNIQQEQAAIDAELDSFRAKIRTALDAENRAAESEISEEKKELRAAMAGVFYQNSLTLEECKERNSLKKLKDSQNCVVREESDKSEAFYPEHAFSSAKERKKDRTKKRNAKKAEQAAYNRIPLE